MPSDNVDDKRRRLSEALQYFHSRTEARRRKRSPSHRQRSRRPSRSKTQSRRPKRSPSRRQRSRRHSRSKTRSRSPKRSPSRRQRSRRERSSSSSSSSEETEKEEEVAEQEQKVAQQPYKNLKKAVYSLYGQKATRDYMTSVAKVLLEPGRR